MAGDCFWLAVEAVQRRDRTESIDLMRNAIMKLPSPNFQVLKRVMEHLMIGSTHEDQTRMAEKQFSLVFGQTILTPPEQGGIKAINAGIQYGNRVVEVMLIHYHAIFEGEADAEGVDSDSDIEAADPSSDPRLLEGLEEVDEEQD